LDPTSLINGVLAVWSRMVMLENGQAFEAVELKAVNPKKVFR